MSCWSLCVLLAAVLVLCVQLGNASYCGYPDPLPYGTISPQQRTYPLGSTVDFACNDGFVLVGQKWTVCVFNRRTRRGIWAHPTPICKSITCPNLKNPRYGSVHVSGTIPGSRADYKCDDGFQLMGVAWRKCQSNGEWTGEAPTCQPINCPDLEAPKYGSVRVSSTRVGGRADYKCNNGFTLVGVAWRKCQANGKWTGEAPTCRPVTCPDLEAPRYGSVRVSSTRVGGRADYKCNDGFTLVGVAWRKCQANGKWTGEAPTCRPVTCPDLEAPQYGSVRVSSTRVGGRADYKCNNGFTVVGVAWRKCQANGRWTGKAPTCQPITCPNLRSPRYGSVKVGSNRVGGRADYRCNRKFKLVGVAWRECQANGRWSGEAPTCQRIVDCGKLRPIRNGWVTLTGTTDGSRATYSCKSGYVLRGNKTRECQSNGHWSGRKPQCVYH